jgi:hypothetical protein
VKQPLSSCSCTERNRWQLDDNVLSTLPVSTKTMHLYKLKVTFSTSTATSLHATGIEVAFAATGSVEIELDELTCTWNIRLVDTCSGLLLQNVCKAVDFVSVVVLDEIWHLTCNNS